MAKRKSGYVFDHRIASWNINSIRLRPALVERPLQLSGMAVWAKELDAGQRVAVGGLNVDTGEHDVWSHKQMVAVVSHTAIEVARLTRVMQKGVWTAIARAFVPVNEKLYSWWSYGANDWRVSNRGRRLDHTWTRVPSLLGPGPLR